MSAGARGLSMIGSLAMIGSSFKAATGAVRACRRFRSDRRGASAVEFALVAPLFIALIFGTLQILVVFMAKAELQQVAQTTSRLVMTLQAGSMTQSQFQSALCANTPAIFTCGGLMVNLQPAASMTSISTTTPTLTYNAGGAVTNTWTYNPGSAGSLMVMQLMYQLPVIAGPLFNLSTQSNGTLLLTSTVVFMNEP